MPILDDMIKRQQYVVTALHNYTTSTEATEETQELLMALIHAGQVLATLRTIKPATEIGRDDGP